MSPTVVFRSSLTEEAPQWSDPLTFGCPRPTRQKIVPFGLNSPDPIIAGYTRHHSPWPDAFTQMSGTLTVASTASSASLSTTFSSSFQRCNLCNHNECLRDVL